MTHRSLPGAVDAVICEHTLAPSCGQRVLLELWVLVERAHPRVTDSAHDLRGLTLLGTVATQILGRNTTNRDTRPALEEQIGTWIGGLRSSAA